MKQGSEDDFQTPSEALEPLLSYLKKDCIIWECAAGRGNLSKRLFKLGFNVVASDILQLDFPNQTTTKNNSYKQYSQKNFLYWEPKKFDCIITNPPFSLKQQFLERCYQLGKPFALLLPLTTFETYKRQRLFKKYGLQIIFFDRRVKFETPSGKKEKDSIPWFQVAWFTNGLNLPKELNFVKLKGAINQTTLM